MRPGTQKDRCRWTHEIRLPVSLVVPPSRLHCRGEIEDRDAGLLASALRTAIQNVGAIAIDDGEDGAVESRNDGANGVRSSRSAQATGIHWRGRRARVFRNRWTAAGSRSPDRPAPQ